MMKNKEKTKFENAVRALEFDKIREKLAYFAPTEGSKALARALMPTSSALVVKKTLAETDAAYSALAAKGVKHRKAAEHSRTDFCFQTQLFWIQRESLLTCFLYPYKDYTVCSVPAPRFYSFLTGHLQIFYSLHKNIL